MFDMLVFDEYTLNRLKGYLEKISAMNNFKWNMPVQVYRTHDNEFVGFESLQYNVGFLSPEFKIMTLQSLPPFDIIRTSFQSFFDYVHSLPVG